MNRYHYWLVSLAFIIWLLPANDLYAEKKRASVRGPDVVLTEGQDRRVYEYRQNGLLRAIKIVPKVGKPYYLVPAQGLNSTDDFPDDALLRPEWQLIEF